ncbi:MAG: MFS transporter [Actinomycetota bacterium]|jgi:MFS family permease|nr:MFS transporter [Actinomycetota bacterium]
MSPRLREAGVRTFLALRVRNFRLYFIGQVISVSGTWMQTVALSLLILSRHLHGNGFDVGAATALQYVPILVFGTWGGVVADRVDKRCLLLVTQSAAGLLALTLGLMTALGVVTLWEVFLLAAVVGVVNLFTNPARQAFVSEMVGRELVSNAVSLNSVLMNSARVIGPAIGGVLIYSSGFATCFFVNAGSFVAVVAALLAMRPQELLRAERVVRAKGQVREGLRYAWRTPGLRDPLLAMAVVGTLAFNFTTTLPLLAEYTFHGGAGTYSTFTAAMGAGAVVGGLLVAQRSRPSTHFLGLVGLGFGAMIALVGLVPTELLTVVALVPMGIGSILFNATANAAVQLTADPSLRGRVMSLYAIAFLGSTPVGAPLMGWVSDAASPRVALAIGAAATLAASGLLVRRWPRPGAATYEAPAAPGAADLDAQRSAWGRGPDAGAAAS